MLLDLMATEVGSQRDRCGHDHGASPTLSCTLVRAWVETRSSDLTGWLAAIRDPQIGMALARIHRTPGESWSVESLANVARLSRSIFTRAIHRALLGVSPARYTAAVAHAACSPHGCAMST